jgi:predicted  nucleic acid-binding Zn-ribbon protein
MSILTPVNPVDSTKLTQTVTDLRNAQPKHDTRTADDLKIELRQLTERVEFHEQKRDRAESELKETNAKFADKTNALNVAKDLVSVRPALRTDIKELEYQLRVITEQIVDFEKEIQRNQNIIDSTRKLVKAFDHKRLKEMEQQEKILAQAGL